MCTSEDRRPAALCTAKKSAPVPVKADGIKRGFQRADDVADGLDLGSCPDITSVAFLSLPWLYSRIIV